MTTIALKGAILKLSFQEIAYFKMHGITSLRCGFTGLQLQVSTLHLVIFCSALDAVKFSCKCMEGTTAVK